MVAVNILHAQRTDFCGKKHTDDCIEKNCITSGYKSGYIIFFVTSTGVGRDQCAKKNSETFQLTKISPSRHNDRNDFFELFVRNIFKHTPDAQTNKTDRHGYKWTICEKVLMILLCFLSSAVPFWPTRDLPWM